MKVVGIYTEELYGGIVDMYLGIKREMQALLAPVDGSV
jgi:hypothetical protein